MTFKKVLATVPGIGVALLPRLAWPACWPAYAGLLSSVGLNFLIGDTYLLPLTIFFLLVAVAMLAYKARHRRGYAPFALGVIGAVAIVTGKFYMDNNFSGKGYIGYAGIFLLVAASVWNAWPRTGAPGTTLHLEPFDENKQSK